MPALTVPPPTKEIFSPVTKCTDLQWLGTHVAGRIDASGKEAGGELRVPHDFHSVVAIELIISARVTAAAMYATLSTTYAAAGEVYNVHTETATGTSLGATTLNIIKAIGISSLVDAGPLAAGDLLGWYVLYNATVTATNLDVLGVRLRYT